MGPLFRESGFLLKISVKLPFILKAQLQLLPKGSTTVFIWQISTDKSKEGREKKPFNDYELPGFEKAQQLSGAPLVTHEYLEAQYPSKVCLCFRSLSVGR